MRAKYLLASAALLGATFVTLTTAQAVPVVWNFDSPTGQLGTSQMYSPTTTASGYTQTITASGFHCSSSRGDSKTSCTPTQLYGKANGGDENGLGLANDLSGDDEITTGYFVQLDLSNLTDPPLDQLTVSFGTNSTTGADIWQVFACSTSGVLCSNMIDQGTTDGVIDPLPDFVIYGPDHFLDVTAKAGNILISEIDSDVSTVPEPASLALLGTGLFGLRLVRRRRTAVI